MCKFEFPLNHEQQRDLAILFSPKRDGQFHYFTFLKYFASRPASNGAQSTVFSRATHLIQSKVRGQQRKTRLSSGTSLQQSWAFPPISIESILERIRCQVSHWKGYTKQNLLRLFSIFRQCVDRHQSVLRLFKMMDKHHTGSLTNEQFNQLLKMFDIRVDPNESYHIMSEIDRNQDGLISYEELYRSLIVDALND